MIPKKNTFFTRRLKILLLAKYLMIGSLAGTLFAPMVLLQTVYGAQQRDEVTNREQNAANPQQQVAKTSIKSGDRALIDRQIRSINGEVIGVIKNVVVDATGQVQYVVASIKGEWGLGPEEAMVPIDKLNLTKQRRYVYFKGTEEEIKMYPNYSDYGWAERRYGSSANALFNREKDLDGDMEVIGDSRVEDRVGSYPMLQRDRQESGSQGIQVSKLIDKQVRNGRGEILGEVNDVIITPAGDIRLVVFINQAINMKNKKVQTDLQDIGIIENADYLVYDVSKEELQNDPSYSPDKHGASLSPGVRRDGQTKMKDSGDNNTNQ